mmetsp:Transcript_70783/g.114077  ORF Transcript_70783/g.114077 Transcript_70783/m.114077 type:complete len:105 (+) Transcript_70783:1-315(+)
MTDWEVFQIVLKWNPMLLGLALFSGVLAAAYNCLLYSLVQSFSPYMAAISSNFNKVAFVAFSVMLGMERLPQAPWNHMMLAAMLGSATSFAYLGLLKSAPAVKN